MQGTSRASDLSSGPYGGMPIEYSMRAFVIFFGGAGATAAADASAGAWALALVLVLILVTAHSEV